MSRLLARDVANFIMITYKYNLLADVLWNIRMLFYVRWFEKNKLIYFKPSLRGIINLYTHRPINPCVKTADDYICYWVSAGTWGAYDLPNKIFICPRNIPNLEQTIRHEIAHLKYEKKLGGLSFEEKEKYISEIENEGND